VLIFVIGSLIYSLVSRRNNTQTQTNQISAEQMALPTTHTVTPGESLWLIAETYYKSGYNWVDIAKENKIINPNVIYAGSELKIPNVKPIIFELGEIESGAMIITPKHAQITVVQGDTLWHLAEQEYGSGYEWGKIAKANALANPNLIHPGNVLRLP